nr:protein aspartic protease in guard cell 2 [Quercus suber]
MGTTILGSLLIGLLMLIKQPGVTIYYAPALFRLAIELQLGLQSLPLPHTMVDNSILAYWFGSDMAIRVLFLLLASRLVYVSTSGTSGSLVLGRERIPTGAAWASLLSNKRATSFYYIELVGLGLEGIWLPIREDVFQISKSCHGGVIMDTDTTMSTFPKVAYEALHDAFVVKTTNGEFLVLHLLHPLLIYLLSIIGNVQQEQVQITFDMASISVGFDPNNG